MQINMGRTFNRMAIVTVLLLTLSSLMIACGDSISNPTATVTTVATTAAPTSQSASAAPATTQSATTAVPPANTTAASTTTQSSGNNPPVALFEDRTTPGNLIKAFYNAINRKEYQRAYSYWQTTGQPNTPASYDQFAKGYSDTASVTFTLGQVMEDAGAGQLYARIPTVLVATHTSGKQETFTGCYTAHRVNKGVSASPSDELWGFTSGTLTLTTTGAQPNSNNCTPDEGRITGPFNDQTSPENLVKSYYNAISVNDYQRAYSYWENPGKGNANTPGPFDQFAKGYTDTTSVFYNLGVVTQDAGAGQVYASIPIVLTSTHTDGTKTTFSGCYVAHRLNNGSAAMWQFRSGTLNPAAANAQPDAKNCAS